MTLTLQDKILETINNSIDGLDLIKLIGYRADTVQVIGTTIKCFCPIHKERVFRSLLVDNKKKQIKCTFKNCIGFNGGTFIDLYAYAFNISPYNAASEIVQKLNLKIDTNVFSLATSELLQTAKKFYEEGKMEEAIQKCLEARHMDASNLEVTRLLIDVYKTINKKEEMARESINLSKILQNKNDFNSAIAVLHQLSENEPQNLIALTELASIYNKTDNREEMIKTYKNIIAIHKEKNQFAEAIDIYKGLLKKDEGLLELRYDLAETFEKTGDIKSAIKEFEKIAKWHKYNSELEKERSIYQRILSLCHSCESRNPELYQKDIETAKISLADVSLRLNDTSQAKSIFKDLAEEHFKSNNYEQAKNFFKKVIEIDENDINSLQRLSTIYDSLGQGAKVLKINKKLLDYFYKTADWNNAQLYAFSIVEREADNLSAREILSTSLIKQGKINEGVDELLKLAETLLNTGAEEEKAIRLFKETLQVKPDDIELKRKIIDHYVKIYAEAKLPQPISDELFNLAKTYTELEQGKQAQQYINIILQRSPSNIPALELALSVSEKQGETDSVISKALNLADLYSLQNNMAQVKTHLSKVFAYDTKNTSAMEKLLELHLNDNETEKALELLKSLIKAYEESEQIDPLITSIEKLFDLVGTEQCSVPTTNPLLRGVGVCYTELKEKLINLYLLKGEKEKALREIVSLANIHIQEESFPEAEKVLVGARLPRPYEDNEDILKALIHLYDRWNLALDIFNRGKPAQSLLTTCRDKFIEYTNQLANIYLSQNDEQKALALLDTIIAKDPECIVTLELQAKILEKMGKKDDSLKILQSLATIYQKKKDLNKYIELLKLLLSHQPDNLKFLEDLSEAYLKTGSISEAIAIIMKIGSLYTTTGDYEKALRLHKKARKLEPKNLEILRKCAELNVHLGNLGDAEKEYRLLAKEFESANNLEEALESYRKIIQFKKEDYEIREKEASLLYDLGETYESMNKYVELVKELDEKGSSVDAIKTCKAALKKDEGRSTLYETLAFLYKKTNDYKKYEQTLRENAHIELLNKNYSKAEKLLLSIRDIAEDDFEILSQLSNVEVELKQVDSAIYYYKLLCDKALQKGDNNLAIKSINSAIELRPDDKELMKFSIDLKLKLCREQAGLFPFDDVKDAALQLARKFIEHGDLEESQKLIAKLKEHSPDPANIHNEIAQLFIQCEIPELAYSEYLEIALLKKEHDLKSAKDACCKGLEIRPGGIELRRIYINLLKETNETEPVYKELELLGAHLENAFLLKDAIEIYKEMTSIKFDDPLPHKKLSALYENLENIDALKDELKVLGKIETNKNDWVAAESAFRQLVELQPDDLNTKKQYIEIRSKIIPEAELIYDYLELANDYQRSNNNNESIFFYKKVLGLDNKNSEAKENFINLLIKEQRFAELKPIILDYANFLINKGESKKAISKLKILCGQIPDDTEILRLLADAYLKINARGMASETLGKIIKLHTESGDFERAILTCEEKLGIDPLDKETRTKLVDLFIKTKRKDQAIEEMMKQADIYIKQELLDLAEAEYRKILDLDPKNVTVRNYLIETHLHMGLEEDMIEEYRALADVYIEKGHINNALKTYKKVIELNPEDIDARIKYADAYLQVGLEEDLINDYIELAKIFSKLGMTKESAELYKKVSALSGNPTNECGGDSQIAPTDDSATKDLSPQVVSGERTLPTTPTTDEVISNYKSILKMNKENAAIRIKLAELYEVKGMFKEALYEYKRASEILFNRGELNDCIKLCEKLMEKDLTDIHIRDRLQKAILRRDSLRALDSAIIAQPDSQKKKRKL